MGKCQQTKHFSKAVYVLVTALWCVASFAQNTCPNRKPANFVPDDDMIIVPMVVEKSFVEEFNEKHKSQFRSARRRLEFWMTQEQYIEDYGLEDTGVVRLPTPEEKERFFRRNYLRFLQRDINRSNQETINDMMSQFNTDDEIDSIKANEQRDQFIIKAKRDKGQKIYKAKKTVKVAGKKFKFDIQPRIEMGMVKVRVDSEYFRLRGWLGVNGNQEINISRTFTSTNTRAMVNYYIEQNRLLGVIDQPLITHWSLRLTHDKTTTDFDSINQSGVSENNTLQLRFGMGF